MPIDYQLDEDRRLITLTVTEPFSFDELIALVDRQWADDAWDHAILYDVRATVRAATRDGLERLIERVRIVGKGASRGPVGLAIPRRAERVRRGMLLSELTASAWNLEVLLSDQQLDDWLRRYAPRRKK